MVALVELTPEEHLSATEIFKTAQREGFNLNPPDSHKKYTLFLIEGETLNYSGHLELIRTNNPYLKTELEKILSHYTSKGVYGILPKNGTPIKNFVVYPIQSTTEIEREIIRDNILIYPFDP